MLKKMEEKEFGVYQIENFLNFSKHTFVPSHVQSGVISNLPRTCVSGTPCMYGSKYFSITNMLDEQSQTCKEILTVLNW